MAAPSKPTPSETTTPEAKAKMKKQKTITIPLTTELEEILAYRAKAIEAQHGFVPTNSQLIAILVNELTK